VVETMDWQALALLPPADGSDVTPEIGGNLLPSFEALALRPGVGMGLRARYQLERHGLDAPAGEQIITLPPFRGQLPK
jgi:hypothetical protein